MTPEMFSTFSALKVLPNNLLFMIKIKDFIPKIVFKTIFTGIKCSVFIQMSIIPLVEDWTK